MATAIEAAALLDMIRDAARTTARKLASNPATINRATMFDIVADVMMGAVQRLNEIRTDGKNGFDESWRQSLRDTVKTDSDEYAPRGNCWHCDGTGDSRKIEHPKNNSWNRRDMGCRKCGSTGYLERRTGYVHFDSEAIDICGEFYPGYKRAHTDSQMCEVYPNDVHPDIAMKEHRALVLAQNTLKYYAGSDGWRSTILANEALMHIKEFLK